MEYRSMDTKQFEVALEVTTNGNKRFMRIVRVGDTIEVHTDDDPMGTPHVELAEQWGKALGWRIGSLIGTFLAEENIV
jgi:hypothetical protein